MSSAAKIEWLSIAQILPNQDNPRHISDDKFRKLVQSIKEMPEMLTARPLVVNQENVVLGGNMRLKALQEVGAEEVPVMRVDWPEDKQRAFIIKDNVSYGEWDWDALANEWDSELLNEWGMEVWEASADIDLDDFFETVDEKSNNSFKIVLDYTEEDYSLVTELFAKHDGSREAVVLKLLGE